MILLDTDILGLYFAAHEKVVARVLAESDQIATTTVTRIEILRGRFDFLMKAANGKQLVRAQELLLGTEQDLVKVAVLPNTAPVVSEFDHLRMQKKLRKIGRADMLISAIALAHQAMLVTRNVKHFRQVPNLWIENWPD